MKILILNYEYPPLGGGAGVCTKYHAEGLSELGHDVTVITAWFQGQKEVEETPCLKIIRVKSKRKFIHKSNPVEMLSWVFKTKRYFSENLFNEKFDICLANFAIPGALAADYIRKKFEIPYIIISHGQDVPWFFPRQLLIYHSLLYFKLKKLFNNSIRNILLTESMRNSVNKLILPKKAFKNVIIPNGCNIDYFKPDYSQKSEKFKIIFVGRLRQQKDPFTFLRAVKILKNKGFDFDVDIIGDGPLRRRIQTFLDRNKLNENVKITGWVNKENMLTAYRNSSLMVSTSIDEGMSIAILEALSSGIYVIATPASGNNELISDKINGEIIGFGNYEELALSIENFYKNKFSNNYRTPDDFLNSFRQKYRWSNIVREYDALIKKML